jgi:hypothetical protein
MAMTDDRFHRIGSYMRHLPLDHALRWCESELCACAGAANCSGGLRKRGVSKDEWQEWWKRTLADILTQQSESRIEEAEGR